MHSILSKQFKKAYAKKAQEIQEQFDERLILFEANPFNLLLRNHKLHGEYEGCRSINITGDVRAVYTETAEAVVFIAIGTHTELYE